ncbi:MAG: ATP-binding cassette domain-containing protein, partial [Bacteroidota bacterium]
MNENLLKSLIRLFAYITVLHSELVYIHTRSFIEKLLRKELHLEETDYYLHLFQESYDEYLKNINETPDKNADNPVLKTICQSIGSDLPVKTRISIIVYLLQFIKYYQMNHFYGHKTDRRLRDTIDFIAKEFGINTDEYQSLREFVFENLYQIYDNKNLLIAGKVNIFPNIKFIQKEHLKGQIYFLNMPSVHIIMFYFSGDDHIELNNKQIFPLTIYLFQKSSVISAENNSPIYYHEVIEYYLENKFNEPIHVSVLDIEYRFKKGNNGIKKLTMHGESGELLGVMGASGTGKTTLMNILNGTIKPQKGSILINGHSIYDEKINFQNVIGYVPQNDMLFEDLTVYKNLYYNT